MAPHPDSLLDFDRARRKALVREVLGLITGEPADLLPFEEVRRQLRLHNSHFRGLHEVPLDVIVGSVGRYRDFTRTFFPRSDSLRSRWAAVDDRVRTSGLPPVELYQVGGAYFVRDGNHRVSIARAQNSPGIEAFVWEYDTEVSVDPEINLDDLLIKAEYVEFLQQTRLDQSRPEQRIEFTTPGRYAELVCQITLYRRKLIQIDGEEISFLEAAALWHDLRYAPIVQIIQESGALREFPGRTEADLFVWILRYQRELSELSAGKVPVSDAASGIKRFSQRPIKKAARRIRRAVPGRKDTALDRFEDDLT